MKRKRSPELDKEFKTQLGSLNKTFQQWVESNNKANPFATSEEGCYDYITYVEQLKAKFCVEGDIWAFGTGDCGQLGMGVDNGDKDTFVTRPREIETLKGEDINGIACGGLHNGALSNGTLYTWGCSDDNCLGREGDENYPTVVKSLRSKFVVQVSMGDTHSCALTMDGQVYIWGAYRDCDGKNWFPVGSGEKSFKHSQLEVSLVKEPSNVARHGGTTQVCSGANHTLALCGDGTVYSWGLGESGQLGRPVCELKNEQQLYQKDLVFRDHLTPQIMEYSSNQPRQCTNARYIEAGSHHSFILQAVRSRVYGCGLNQYGQLGLPAEKTTYKALEHIPLDEFCVKTIHGGEHSSLLVTRDGDVYTFGRADNFQLGVKLSTPELSSAGASTYKPQKVDIPVKVTQAASGSFHCAAVGEDSSLYMWGYGEMAQLGMGKAKDEELPKKVTKKNGEPLRVATVSLGAQHTVVVLKASN